MWVISCITRTHLSKSFIIWICAWALWWMLLSMYAFKEKKKKNYPYLCGSQVLYISISWEDHLFFLSCLVIKWEEDDDRNFKWVQMIGTLTYTWKSPKLWISLSIPRSWKTAFNSCLLSRRPFWCLVLRGFFSF